MYLPSWSNLTSGSWSTLQFLSSEEKELYKLIYNLDKKVTFIFFNHKTETIKDDIIFCFLGICSYDPGVSSYNLGAPRTISTFSRTIPVFPRTISTFSRTIPVFPRTIPMFPRTNPIFPRTIPAFPRTISGFSRTFPVFSRIISVFPRGHLSKTLTPS